WAAGHRSVKPPDQRGWRPERQKLRLLTDPPHLLDTVTTLCRRMWRRLSRTVTLWNIQSVQSEDGDTQTKDGEEGEGGEEGETQTVVPPVVTENVAEGEEVSLDFESFLHNNGTLYSCFNHHGNRVYVDESQKLQPFPSEWYNQGRFLTANNQGSGQLQTPASNQSAVREDD
ncbi:hypothetical protein LDENG_00188140, partial [Lucifuga dentata]